MVGYVQKWQVEPTIYWKMWVAIKVQPRLRIPGFNLSLRTENLQVGFSGGTQVGQCPTWVGGFRCRSPRAWRAGTNKLAGVVALRVLNSNTNENEAIPICVSVTQRSE